MPFALRTNNIVHRTPAGQAIKMSDGFGAGLDALLASFNPGFKMIKGLDPAKTSFGGFSGNKSMEGSIELGDKYGFWSIKGCTDNRNITIKSPWGDVKINAFFPYAAITPTGIYTIGTSQVSRTEYEACDLMSATVTGRDESAPLTLTFRHLASKITVNLSTTQSGISLSYSKIKLLNVAREARIDAAEGVITSVSGSATDPVLISNDGRTASSGIILPQVINANTRFIEIELLTKEKVYGIMPTTYTFEPGKSYVFNIDVQVDRDASEFLLNDPQIVDWVNETPQEIEGERTN
jgi:hypothetical protein